MAWSKLSAVPPTRCNSAVDPSISVNRNANTPTASVEAQAPQRQRPADHRAARSETMLCAAPR